CNDMQIRFFFLYIFSLGMVAIRGRPVQKYHFRVVGSLLRTVLACKFMRGCAVLTPRLGSFFFPGDCLQQYYAF
ncbi:hypothetical protein BJY52DRAFT_1266749, partial [Lactarius psammicola]